jgi:CheY-like chemotaxis protein
MSPEKAKVFVAEDSEDWKKIIKDELESEGHIVVATASTLKEALETAKKLKELGVDVAVIDGNLGENIFVLGSDGQAVLAAVRENAPKVKTVGMSSFSVRGTDVDLGKMDVKRLGKVVSDL